MHELVGVDTVNIELTVNETAKDERPLIVADYSSVPIQYSADNLPIKDSWINLIHTTYNNDNEKKYDQLELAILDLPSISIFSGQRIGLGISCGAGLTVGIDTEQFMENLGISIWYDQNSNSYNSKQNQLTINTPLVLTIIATLVAPASAVYTIPEYLASLNSSDVAELMLDIIDYIKER